MIAKDAQNRLAVVTRLGVALLVVLGGARLGYRSWTGLTAKKPSAGHASIESFQQFGEQASGLHEILYLMDRTSRNQIAQLPTAKARTAVERRQKRRGQIPRANFALVPVTVRPVFTREELERSLVKSSGKAVGVLWDWNFHSRLTDLEEDLAKLAEAQDARLSVDRRGRIALLRLTPRS